jgi:F0F1-type ATP synthase epsilon subunit
MLVQLQGVQGSMGVMNRQQPVVSSSQEVFGRGPGSWWG